MMKLRSLVLAAASLAFLATAGPAMAAATENIDLVFPNHVTFDLVGADAAVPVDYAMLDVCLMAGGESGDGGGGPPADPPAPQPDPTPKPGDPKPGDPAPTFHMRC